MLVWVIPLIRTISCITCPDSVMMMAGKHAVENHHIRKDVEGSVGLSL